jgi:hypothetical protein
MPIVHTVQFTLAFSNDLYVFVTICFFVHFRRLGKYFEKRNLGMASIAPVLLFLQILWINSIYFWKQRKSAKFLGDRGAQRGENTHV